MTSSNVSKVTAKCLQCKPVPELCPVEQPALPLSQTQKILVMGKYTYKPQYGVIVICADEKEQQAIYERLKAEGLILKVVNV